jgi:ATP-dependent protease ClpP protease subunit
VKLKVKGDIIVNDDKWIYEFIGWDSCCPKDAEEAVAACAEGEELEVEISSGGGSVIAGSEIYSILSGYKGPMTITVTGLAASAASVIAMAGRCEMTRTALMMIHNTATVAAGDYRDMESAAEMLRTANEAIRAAYRHKTGLDEETLSDMMDRETWITAEKAVEYGFADAVAGDSEVMPAAAAFGNDMGGDRLARIRALIEKVRGGDNNTDNGSSAYAPLKTLEQAEADYNFMMLKGARK